MARPRETEKARALALRAAAVLERRGLDLPAEQLARELGVKRPTLLYHFPTYARIVETALVELLAAQASFVDERVAAHEHPIDRLHARMRSIHAFHEGRGGRLLFLTQALATTGGDRTLDILRTASSFFDAERRDMVARIERGIREGIVHACDANALVALLRAVIDGLAIQSVLSPGSAERVHQLVWKTVLHPLKRSRRRASKSKRN